MKTLRQHRKETLANITLDVAQAWNDSGEQWVFACDSMLTSANDVISDGLISRFENRCMKLLKANGVTVK